MTRIFELLGRRWQLRVIWELRHDGATFRELQRRCEGISPSVLADRLHELREAGIVVNREGYRLTEAGIELLEVYPPISAWARRWPVRLP
jgi:DNA-binding HxlR family transcriptional regulator